MFTATAHAAHRAWPRYRYRCWPPARCVAQRPCRANRARQPRSPGMVARSATRTAAQARLGRDRGLVAEAEVLEVGQQPAVSRAKGDVAAVDRGEVEGVFVFA